MLPPNASEMDRESVTRQMGSSGPAHTIFNRILGFPSPALANCRLPPDAAAARMDGMTATTHAQDPASTSTPSIVNSFFSSPTLDPAQHLQLEPRSTAAAAEYAELQLRVSHFASSSRSV